jgi:CheY-like chemotaxis protein
MSDSLCLPPRTAPSAGPSENDQRDGIRVFVVDDEPIIVRVIQLHLQRAGYLHVTGTTDSTQALRMIREQRPNVVLLDLTMPGVSGLDILAALRQDLALRSIPVVVITATSDMELKRRVMDLGAVEILSKPVDAVDLVYRVRSAAGVPASGGTAS